MSRHELATRPIFQCLNSRPQTLLISRNLRFFTSASSLQNEAQIQKQPSPDPLTVTNRKLERELTKARNPPIGSRRRRAALRQASDIPFEQLPYQCFQEARKILLADREEKTKQIEMERARIARLKDAPLETMTEAQRENKLRSMNWYLEKLKILADINDPMVKKKFEDGKGDMNKPIYRFLANRKWREYRRPVLVQRITQMHVVPDAIAHIDPTADVKLFFQGRNIPPGDFVLSKTSETVPRLNVQLFEKGGKLITIAVVDSDVPDVENDGFDSRCHFLAVNIPISPTSPFVDLANLAESSQLVLPWAAPYAQKGSPYHRLSTMVFAQHHGEVSDVDQLRNETKREGFSLRALQTKLRIKPIGAHLFRTQWDETMADVMKRAGVEGVEIQLKRARLKPLPYKRRNPSSMR